MKKLTHFDARGQAHMVDVGAKAQSHRVAVARGRIVMQRSTVEQVRGGNTKKGDVLGVARVAAIQGAKRTAELIPLAHPLAMTRIAVEFTCDAKMSAVECMATVETFDRTGVEMEALTAVAIALLTIYDMCKAADRGMTIEALGLVEKRGGRSGVWVRKGR